MVVVNSGRVVGVVNSGRVVVAVDIDVGMVVVAKVDYGSDQKLIIAGEVYLGTEKMTAPPCKGGGGGD